MLIQQPYIQHPAVNGDPQEPELPQESTTKPQALNLPAGISSKGEDAKMTQAMADSIEQQDLFAQLDRNLTLFKAISFNKDQEHTAHLAIQDRMQHLVAFDVNNFILNPQ